MAVNLDLNSTMERLRGDARAKLVLNWLVGVATIAITARYLHYGQVALIWLWVHFETIRLSGEGRYLRGAIASATASFAIVFAVYQLIAPVYYIQIVVVVALTIAGMMPPAFAAHWLYRRAKKRKISEWVKRDDEET